MKHMHITTPAEIPTVLFQFRPALGRFTIVIAGPGTAEMTVTLSESFVVLCPCSAKLISVALIGARYAIEADDCAMFEARHYYITPVIRKSRKMDQL